MGKMNKPIPETLSSLSICPTQSFPVVALKRTFSLLFGGKHGYLNVPVEIRDPFMTIEEAN